MPATALSVRTHATGAAVVLAGVCFQSFLLGRPAMFVSVGLVVAYGLWVASPWRFTPRLKVVFSIAVIAFLCHAAEEFLSGFHQALPALFGRARWSDGEYVMFNAVWAVVFALAATTAAAERPLTVLVMLFFAVAGGVGNGLVHLLLVLQRGAYFPGAWTAPLCLLLGAWLLRLLYKPEAGVTRVARG